MGIICTLLNPFVNVSQQLLNIAWFPLSIFGIQAPTVGTIIGPIVGCNF